MGHNDKHKSKCLSIILLSCINYNTELNIEKVYNTVLFYES